LSLKLFIDECMLEKLLVAKLKAAGHDVETVTDVGLRGKPDSAVFSHAIAEDRVVFTSNCVDFQVLAQGQTDQGNHHPGVLLLFLINIPGKGLSHDDIIQAIANLESTGCDLKDQAVVLNHYKY